MILVTGLSGSGKTHKANELRYELNDKYKDKLVSVVSLDYLTGYFCKPDKYNSKLKNCKPVYDFINDIIKKKYVGSPIKINWYSDNNGIHNDFLNYLSMKESSGKYIYIVEGIQLFTVINKKAVKTILTNPKNELIIIKKGFFECTWNRLKRGCKNLKQTTSKYLFKNIYNIFHYDIGFEHIEQRKRFVEFCKEFDKE